MHAVEESLVSMTFDDIVALTGDDMVAVDRLIAESLKSDVVLVSQVSEYIVTSGGKRLRPIIVLLAARAFGYAGEQHVRHDETEHAVAEKLQAFVAGERAVGGAGMGERLA